MKFFAGFVATMYLLGAVGLGVNHYFGHSSVAGPFLGAIATMDRVDLWPAKLASKTLRLDQRQAIAEAAEG